MMPGFWMLFVVGLQGVGFNTLGPFPTYEMCEAVAVSIEASEPHVTHAQWACLFTPIVQSS